MNAKFLPKIKLFCLIFYFKSFFFFRIRIYLLNKTFTLLALIARFEPPNSMNRWDSPLFTIQTTDQLPFDDIFNALFAKSMPKPNMSTQNPPLMSPSFIHEVDIMLQVRIDLKYYGRKCQCTLNNHIKWLLLFYSLYVCMVIYHACM